MDGARRAHRVSRAVLEDGAAPAHRASEVRPERAGEHHANGHLARHARDHPRLARARRGDEPRGLQHLPDAAVSRRDGPLADRRADGLGRRGGGPRCAPGSTRSPSDGTRTKSACSPTSAAISSPRWKPTSSSSARGPARATIRRGWTVFTWSPSQCAPIRSVRWARTRSATSTRWTVKSSSVSSPRAIASAIAWDARGSSVPGRAICAGGVATGACSSMCTAASWTTRSSRTERSTTSDRRAAIRSRDATSP